LQLDSQQIVHRHLSFLGAQVVFEPWPGAIRMFIGFALLLLALLFAALFFLTTPLPRGKRPACIAAALVGRVLIRRTRRPGWLFSHGIPPSSRIRVPIPPRWGSNTQDL